jgi:hypothetical protein
MAESESKHEWDQDVIDHFKITSAYVSRVDVIKEIYKFIQAARVVKKEQSEKALAKDLIKKVFGNLKTTIKQRRENHDRHSN